MDAEALEQIRRIFLALDYVGVFIFAITGALVAVRHRQDFLTCAFFAGMTGMGGGTIRDLLIGAPVFWVGHSGFLLVCMAAALAVWFLHAERWPGRPLQWLDGMGLSAYCAFGTLKALNYDVDVTAAALMGVITATFGGVLRDIIAGQPSVIMQRDVYISAAVAGAAATVIQADFLGWNTWIAGIIGASLAMAIRGGAILFGWKLPTHRS